MRPIGRLIVVALLAYANIAQAQSSELWKPTKEEVTRLAQETEILLMRFLANGVVRKHTPWDILATISLNSFALNKSTYNSSLALEALLSLQDTSKNSKTYGNFKWYTDDDRVLDLNGVEFSIRHLLLIWKLYRNKMSGKQVEEVYRALADSRGAIDGHEISIKYTNIFLMNICNRILLGEALGDQKLQSSGRQRLKEWISRSTVDGTDEYLSPTYTAIDLENLSLIENLSNDLSSKALARKALDLLWLDVAKHWFAPQARLGGPHSRDYDRLYNTGPIDNQVSRAGWRKERSVVDGPFGAYAYSPPSAVANRIKGSGLPRFMIERVGSAGRISSYWSKNLYIGSASSGYSAHDNTLVANLGAGADVPTISMFMDGRGDYYGLKKILEPGSGHLKSLHLRPFIASVQAGPEVLYLTSGTAETKVDSSLETTMILPADAEYFIDGRRLPIFSSTSKWKLDTILDGDNTSLSIEKDIGGRVLALMSNSSSKVGLGLSQSFPSKFGQEYVFSADVLGKGFSLHLDFEDGSGNIIWSQSVDAGEGNRIGFGRISVRATAPLGATRLRARIFLDKGKHSSIRIRDLTVMVGSTSKIAWQQIARFDFREFKAESLPINTGSTLVVRRGAAALAIRPLAAWNDGGIPIKFRLINDGLANNALRLTATHSRTHSNGVGTAAVWLLGQDFLSDEYKFEQFIQRAMNENVKLKTNGSNVFMEANGEKYLLRLEVDLKKRSSVSYRISNSTR